MHSTSICAVIVLYFPDNCFKNRLHHILKQVDAVVLVDNSGDDESHIFHQAFVEPRIHLLCNDSNLGVATALNQGVQWAEQHGYKWTLLFDQDTDPMEEMCNVLFDVYHGCCKNGEKALVGANYINGLGNVQVACDEMTTAWIQQKTIITSGTLLSLEVYALVGPFRDDFFIDAVDYDYCLKARAKGIRVVLSCDPLMRHAIGTQTRHNLPWKKTAVSNHNAMRRYYMARNNLVLVQEYWIEEPIWVLKRLGYVLKTMVLILCFEENKIEKLSAFVIGLWHALIGKMGNVRS